MLGLGVKLARPRTWAFIVLAYSIGWSLTGSPFSLQYAVGLIIYILLVANVNIINAYTDIDEDRINLPRRVKMVEQIGYKRLPYIVAAISIICLALSFTINWVFSVILIIALLNGLFYSLRPLRFKTHPVLSLFSFSGAVVFPLIGAWVITKNIIDIPLLIIFLGFSFLVYGTIKNLPDYYGDKAVGLTTTATIFRTRKQAIVAATFLLLSPYALLLALVGLNIIDIKFLWLLTLLPIITLICYGALTMPDTDNLEKLHTYGFFYETLVLSLTVFLVTNILTATVIVLTTLAATYIIQRTGIDSR